MVVHKMSRDDWKVEQESDSVIGLVITAIKTKKFDDDALSNGSKRLLHSRSQLLFRCGLLYRKVFDGQLQENKFQFVLLQSYWKQALEACHDNMGHLGTERTITLLKDHFYWLSMVTDVEKHIRSCPNVSSLRPSPRKLS